MTMSISATPQAKALANSNWLESGRRFAATPRTMINPVCTAKAAQNMYSANLSSLSFLNAVPVNSRMTATPYITSAIKNIAFMVYPSLLPFVPARDISAPNS